MFFEGVPHDDNVIEINQDASYESPPRTVPIRHSKVAVRVELYLPILTFEIYGRKPGIGCKCVQRVIYPWQRIAVLLGDVIQPTIVHTESS
ncbi:hypothetical protein TNCV_156631 [Trichonephila clavipes]|nr:hypothetical protein TNCV_156631 [Trichonephila clavipes]